MEIKKISLQQNLRDDLIFDLFAPKTTKDILLSTKNEKLRRGFKRLWVKYYVEYIASFKSSVDEADKSATRVAVKLVAFEVLCISMGELEFRDKTRRLYEKPFEIFFEDGDFS